MKLPPQFKQIMKQMEKVQKEFEELQKQAESIQATVQVGGGMVEVTANAKGEVVKVKIEPDLLDPEEKEMLQDLIVAGVNAAIKQAREEMEKKTAQLLAKFNLPSFPGMPGLF